MPTAVLTHAPVAGACSTDRPKAYPALREWIAARHSTPSVRLDPANVLVTTGSQQALDLLGKTLIDVGSRVLVETPTYLGALQAFSLFEPQFVSVPSDEDGPLPCGADARAARRARASCTACRTSRIPPAGACRWRAVRSSRRSRRTDGPARARRRSVRRAVLFGRCAADLLSMMPDNVVTWDRSRRCSRRACASAI